MRKVSGRQWPAARRVSESIMKTKSWSKQAMAVTRQRLETGQCDIIDGSCHLKCKTHLLMSSSNQTYTVQCGDLR